MENVGGGAGTDGSKGDRKQMVQMALRCLMNSRSKEKLRTGYLESFLCLTIKHCLGSNSHSYKIKPAKCTSNWD